jgi:hypothetical protein
MGRIGNRIHIPFDMSTAVSLLLRVKPTSKMPRPGAHRQKSVWAEVEAEEGDPQKRDLEEHGPPTPAGH